MPRGDRTGPLGAGPRTGRGMGFCAGYNVPGFMNSGPGFGYGMGRGRGFGRGNRWGFYATGMPGWARGSGYGTFMPQSPYPNEPATHNMRQRDELRALKEQARELSKMLEEVNARIDDLTNEKSNKE